MHSAAAPLCGPVVQNRAFAEEVAVREERRAQTPVIWALAGAAPHSGCSIAAFLLAGVATQTGRESILFRPGQWDAPQKQPLPHTLSLNQQEIAGFFERLGEECKHSAQVLYHRLSQSDKSPLWILDLGCSRAHAQWDLFWSADHSLLIAGSRDEEALQRMAQSAWLRWLERTLALDDDSLHAFIRAASEQPAKTGGYDYFSSSRLQQVGEAHPIPFILLQRQASLQAVTSSGEPIKSAAGIAARKQLSEAGVLICDCPTALLIRDLHAQFHSLPHEAYLWLQGRLEERLNPAGEPFGTPRMAAGSLRAHGFYTRIGNKQILNIDLNYFDMPSVVSPFAATEDEL
jgi:hypothetical protein